MEVWSWEQLSPEQVWHLGQWQPQQFGRCCSFAGDPLPAGNPKHPLVKCLNSKQCTCLGTSNLSSVTGQLPGKCLFSRGIVKLNECQHSLLVLERASPLFWPNSRNIKDVFRQWERERVWRDGNCWARDGALCRVIMVGNLLQHAGEARISKPIVRAESSSSPGLLCVQPVPTTESKTAMLNS